MHRKALLVGIETYANPRHNLPGVSNDISAMVRILSRFGVDDIQVIRDANATLSGIQTALNALVDRPKPGDVFLFYFSGHGALLPAGFAGSDDIDQQDEAFVPYEASTSSLLLDNWIAAFLRERLPPESGASFYGIYDCCHSGELHKSFSLGVRPKSWAGMTDAAAKAGQIKEVDIADLTFTGVPALLRGKTLKSFIQDETIPNSVHIGASEPHNTALVLSIDGDRRSVFTWALEQVARPGLSIEQFEKELTETQAKRTSHHKPVVTASGQSRARELFR